MRLRAALFVLSLSCMAAPSRGQEERFFSPDETAKVRLELGWDLLARYDSIYHLVFRPDIERGRFEFRPEAALIFSDRFRVGARAVADWGTDENSENGRNFDNYRSRGVSLERYFVEAKPGPLVLRAGSFGMPLVSTEMLWDRDIQVLGAAAAWEIPAGRSTFTVAGGGFRGPQREGDRTRVAAGQVVWRLGDPATLLVEAAGSFWSLEPDDLKPVYVRQNYSLPAVGGHAAFVSRFEIADLLIRLRFPVGPVPVTVSLDGLSNRGVRGEAEREGEGEAFEGTVSAGRVGAPGNVRAFYTFQYVERDAVLGAYNTDDWWFHSWYQGHRFGVAVTVLPRLFVQGTGMIQKRLDRTNHLNRVTVDLVKMF